MGIVRDVTTADYITAHYYIPPLSYSTHARRRGEGFQK